MREIKFRAWDKNKKEWIKTYYNNVKYIPIFNDNTGLINVEYDDLTGVGSCYKGWDKNDIELMQYTGLKDKNGKEIYTGDIVSRPGVYPFFDKEKPNYIGLIEISNGHTWITLRCVNKEKRGISDGTSQYFEESTHVEIIGNIHENPELLEEQQC